MRHLDAWAAALSLGVLAGLVVLMGLTHTAHAERALMTDDESLACRLTSETRVVDFIACAKLAAKQGRVNVILDGSL